MATVVSIHQCLQSCALHTPLVLPEDPRVVFLPGTMLPWEGLDCELQAINQAVRDAYASRNDVDALLDYRIEIMPHDAEIWGRGVESRTEARLLEGSVRFSLRPDGTATVIVRQWIDDWGRPISPLILQSISHQLVFHLLAYRTRGHWNENHDDPDAGRAWFAYLLAVNLCNT